MKGGKDGWRHAVLKAAGSLGAVMRLQDRKYVRNLDLEELPADESNSKN